MRFVKKKNNQYFKYEKSKSLKEKRLENSIKKRIKQIEIFRV